MLRRRLICVCVSKQISLTPEPSDKYPIKWLVTTDLPDDAFQPNINGGNTDTLEKSHDIGVLKPQHRDIKNFKFYKYNTTDKKWYEFNIDKIKV